MVMVIVIVIDHFPFSMFSIFPFFPTYSLKICSLDRTMLEKGWEILDFANVLVKRVSGKFSQMFGYESRESGREIIPGMHRTGNLGIYGGS